MLSCFLAADSTIAARSPEVYDTEGPGTELVGLSKRALCLDS